MTTYTGLQLSELKARTLQRLKQPAANYDRYTESVIEGALNSAVVEVVKQTKCKRASGILNLVDGQMEYDPPSGMMIPIKIRYYASNVSYNEVKLRTQDWLDQNNAGWRTTEDLPTLFVYPGDTTTTGERKVGVVPIPNSNGSGTTLADIVKSLWISFVKYPEIMDEDTDCPDIPPYLHQFLPDYAVYVLKRSSPKGTNDYDEAMEAKSAFYSGIKGYVDLEGWAEETPFTDDFTGPEAASGISLEDLIARTMTTMGLRPGDYSKVTKASVVRALNDAQVETVRETKCLRNAAILDMVSGTQQYSPPTDFLQLDKAFFYDSASSYYEMTQRSRRWLDRHSPGWRTETGDPLSVFSGETSGKLRKIGVTPTPDTDGSGTDLSDISNNVWIEYIRTPTMMTADSDYPDIPKEMQQHLPAYAAAVVTGNQTFKALWANGIGEFCDPEDALEDDESTAYYL